MNFPAHIALAIEAAQKACREIMQVYAQDFERIIKADGSPLTQADLNSSRVILKTLSTSNIPVISEEITNLSYEEPKKWQRCWIIDPLDGTKEFIKKNGEFCVCIALIEEGAPIFGLIASPVESKAWVAEKTIGLYEIDFSTNFVQRLPISTAQKAERPIVLASRSHLSIETQQYIEQLQTKFRNLQYASKGSALKFIDLALGRAHYYPRFAPTMEWDVAAGQAILEVAGGKIVRANNHQALCYNKENLVNPYFIATANGWSV